MRRNKQLPPKGGTKYAVIGDGQCEVWYIQMLRRNERTIGIDLKPEIPQRKKLSEQFAKVLELSRDYDKIFWIVDYDVIASETRLAKKGARTTQQEFKEYCDKIEGINRKITPEVKDEPHKKKIIVIINNPCLEYWFLLHFEPTARYFNNCESANRRLRRYLPDYEKSQSYYTREGNDIYLRLKPHLTTAIVNARRSGIFDFTQPASGISEMHLLFETLGIGSIPKRPLTIEQLP